MHTMLEAGWFLGDNSGERDGWGKEWQDLEGIIFPSCKKCRDEDMSYRMEREGNLVQLH